MLFGNLIHLTQEISPIFALDRAYHSKFIIIKRPAGKGLKCHTPKIRTAPSEEADAERRLKSKRITEPRRRAYSFSRFREASVTVEAALCLPILLFAMYLISMPVRVMNETRLLQERMEESARLIAQAAYAESVGESLIKSDSEYAEFIREAAVGAGAAAAEVSFIAAADRTVLTGMMPGLKTSVLSRDEDADPDLVCFELLYRSPQPFSMFGFSGTELSSIASRRAWVGAKGGRGREKYSDGGDEDAEDPVVYVGKSSTRYHTDRHCHYLDNVFYEADASAMAGLRNAGGGKYHACPYCSPPSSGTVYYFRDGTAYHASRTCGAVTAYVREVHLSEVSHLGPCSYCSK